MFFSQYVDNARYLFKIIYYTDVKFKYTSAYHSALLNSFPFWYCLQILKKLKKNRGSRLKYALLPRFNYYILICSTSITAIFTHCFTGNFSIRQLHGHWARCYHKQGCCHNCRDKLMTEVVLFNYLSFRFP